MSLNTLRAFHFHLPYCKNSRHTLKHTFDLKPNCFCSLFHLCFFFVFVFPNVPSAFEQSVPRTDLWNRLPLFISNVCLQLSSTTSALPFSSSGDGKHAVNFLWHYRLRCRHLRKSLPAAATLKSTSAINRATTFLHEDVSS